MARDQRPGAAACPTERAAVNVRTMCRLRGEIDPYDGSGARPRRVSFPIFCPKCGEPDRLVRLALGGGSDEIRALYGCDRRVAREACASAILVTYALSAPPSCVVRDVTSRAHTLTLEVGAEAAFAALVAGDVE